MPHRQDLLDKIRKYVPVNGIEEHYKLHIQSFIENHSSCFDRECLGGHITGSSFVIDESKQNILLMHHKKYNIWVQFGGHCDSDPDVLNVAKRELEEESGITNYSLILEDIFDVDVHKIPKHNNVPEHFHYDVRFLFQVPLDVQINMQESEVNDIKWFKITEVMNIENSDFNERVYQKLLKLK